MDGTTSTFIDRVRLGDQQALSEFVHEQLPAVYNLCLRLSRNPQDAEDLSQEVFLKAVRALAGFKGDSSLKTWLYRVAVNTWKNRVRYESRRHFRKHVSLSVEDEDGESVEREIPDPGPGPEKVADRGEFRSLANQALDRLDADDKAIVVLRDIENKTYEEIAEALDMTMGTVKSRLSRAREAFRIEYKRLGGTSL